MTNAAAVPADDNYDEMIALKDRANLMGIKFHPNIGVKTLRAKIDARLQPDENMPTVTDEHNFVGDSIVKVDTKGKRTWLTHAEFLMETKSKTRKDLNRLVRVRVSCMNPNKREWEGEIISVGSARAGTFKKFVPFNGEEGYHIPNIIYQAMKERQYTSFFTVKGPRGEKIRKGKLVPEFNIEVMPALDKEELRLLAQRQQATNAID